MSFFAEFQLLLFGLLIGFLIAMPVGAVAVLTVKRTLHSGWPTGVATGLGAAAADALYAAVAAFGVYAIQDFLIQHQYSLRVVGGAALLIVGIRMLWQKTEVKPLNTDDTDNDPDAWHRIFHSFVTGLIITLTNPLTLIAFLTVFTNFGMTDEMHTYRNALVFVAGAFLGAVMWWLSLVGAVVLIKARLSETLVAKINAVLAVFLVLAGAYAMMTGYLEKPLGKLLH